MMGECGELTGEALTDFYKSQSAHYERALEKAEARVKELEAQAKKAGGILAYRFGENARLAARAGELGDLLRKHATMTSFRGRVFCRECGQPEGMHTEKCIVFKALASDGSAVADVIAAAGKLMQEAGGILLPWEAYADDSTINLVCSQENVLELKQALNQLDGKEADDVE